jgi:hypothetical protein
MIATYYERSMSYSISSSTTGSYNYEEIVETEIV